MESPAGPNGVCSGGATVSDAPGRGYKHGYRGLPCATPRDGALVDEGAASFRL
jgi:hypothetical protein